MVLTCLSGVRQAASILGKDAVIHRPLGAGVISPANLALQPRHAFAAQSQKLLRLELSPNVTPRAANFLNRMYGDEPRDRLFDEDAGSWPGLNWHHSTRPISW
jgi:hypothetical protein